MSLLKDAWSALQTVTTLTDRYARQAAAIEELQREQRLLRDRLIVLETAFQIAARQPELRGILPELSAP